MKENESKNIKAPHCELERKQILNLYPIKKIIDQELLVYHQCKTNISYNIGI